MNKQEPDSRSNDASLAHTSTPDMSQLKEPKPVSINFDRYSKKAAKNARKMAKRVYVAHSPIHGKGLFATKAIKAGVSLGRLHGMLTEEEGIHVLWLNKRLGLELTNEFRFINHDANPNCALTDTDVVTLRDIAADEEITHDYGW